MQPPAPAPEVITVPPVADRPLDIDEGDRIVVTRFELVGAEDRPEFGVSVEEIQALLEQKRGERADGFTVGRLTDVSSEVTRYYRAKGLILAQAFIPVQDVQDGVVKVQVLEGRLGRVLVEGNKRYTAEILQKPFDKHLAQPITKEQMESELLGITEYPGLGVNGVFQPGVEVGAADLVLNVSEERRLEARLRHDNHGLAETGQKRYQLDVDVNNVTGAADRLSGTGQVTAAPRDLYYWRIEYMRPLWFDPSYRLNVNYDVDKFDVRGALRDEQIFTATRNLHASIEKQILRGRQRNLSARLDLSRKRSQTKARGRPVSIDNLAPLMFEVNYDSVDTRFSGLNFAQAQISHGFNDLLGAMGGQGTVSEASVSPSRVDDNRRFATGEFDKLFLTYQRLQALSILNEKLNHHSLLFRFEGQYSSDLLVAAEQFSIGGPTSVRAYQPAEMLADKGYLASIEWIIDAPGLADTPSMFGNRTWGELLRLHLFYDRAYGRVNDPLTPGASQVYDGAGFAFSFENPNAFSSRISIAFPFDDPRSANGKDPQAWVDFTLYY